MVAPFANRAEAGRLLAAELKELGLADAHLDVRNVEAHDAMHEGVLRTARAIGGRELGHVRAQCGPLAMTAGRSWPL